MAQVINKFVLGQKEVEGKKLEFHYDRGQYFIFEAKEEEKSQLYKSRNAQEAYKKWNTMIGRKKGQRNEEKRKEAKELKETKSSKKGK